MAKPEPVSAEDAAAEYKRGQAALEAEAARRRAADAEADAAAGGSNAAGAS